MRSLIPITAFIIAAVCSISTADDTAQAEYTAKHALVIRDDGFYILAPDTTTLVKVAAGKIVDQRTGVAPDPDDPTPPGDPNPTLSDRGKQISMLSSIVSDKQVATALSTVLRSLHSSGLEGASAKQGFDTAFSMVLNTVKGSVPADWSQWKVQVTGLADETGWDGAILKDVADGLSDALGVQVDVSNAVAKIVASGTMQAGLTEDGQLDIGKLIAIIMQILELLRDLGILD